MCNCHVPRCAMISRTLEYSIDELSNHDSIRLPETSEEFTICNKSFAIWQESHRYYM